MKRTQQYQKQTANMSRTHRLKPTKFLWILIVVLLVLQVFVSNKVATSGSEIVKIESEIETLSQENSVLTEKIASASAILTIRKKAEELGFEKTAKPVFFHTEQTVALDLP